MNGHNLRISKFGYFYFGAYFGAWWISYIGTLRERELLYWPFPPSGTRPYHTRRERREEGRGTFHRVDEGQVEQEEPGWVVPRRSVEGANRFFDVGEGSEEEET
ncbi:hypothetical protein APHAL10511_008528 [Amanita phalloides]|nr:hypothetical protein APHAL10511_008528 [Amanita phalloides]